MCNVEIAEVYVVENAPYCKLNYNMARFLFYLLSLLSSRVFFPVFCSPYPWQPIFYSFGAWLWVFFLSSALHTHSSLFFITFGLGCGYFSCLMLSIPIAVYFFCFFAWLWVFFLSYALHTHSSLFFIAFLLGCGYFSCLMFSHTHSSLFFIAFLLGCGYFS